jgi:hypothetical protein
MAINIALNNTDMGDLFVSVLDLNIAGTPAVINNQRINEDQSLLVSVQEDGTGDGRIIWSAVRCDDATKTAQHSTSVSNDDNVDITTQFG